MDSSDVISGDIRNNQNERFGLRPKPYLIEISNYVFYIAFHCKDKLFKIFLNLSKVLFVMFYRV